MGLQEIATLQQTAANLQQKEITGAKNINYAPKF